MPHQEFIKDGVNYPSVTTVIGCLSTAWKEFWWRKVGFAEADRISKESRELGTACHALVEEYLTGKLEQIPDGQVGELFRLWLEWYEKSGYSFVSQEELVVSEKYVFCGTYDCLLKDKEGNLVLADWKFSKNDDNLRPLQLAGYAIALSEQGIDVKTAIIVRVDPKERKVVPKMIKSLVKAIKAFLIVRKVFDISKGKF